MGNVTVGQSVFFLSIGVDWCYTVVVFFITNNLILWPLVARALWGTPLPFVCVVMDH